MSIAVTYSTARKSNQTAETASSSKEEYFPQIVQRLGELYDSETIEVVRSQKCQIWGTHGGEDQLNGHGLCGHCDRTQEVMLTTARRETVRWKDAISFVNPDGSISKYNSKHTKPGGLSPEDMCEVPARV